MSERFAALKASKGPDGDIIEFWGNDSPKCPHCGHEVDISEGDLWRLYEEGSHEVSCPKCDQDFAVTTRVSYSFDTDEQDDFDE